jgi:hypothetical protein
MNNKLSLITITIIGTATQCKRRCNTTLFCIKRSSRYLQCRTQLRTLSIRRRFKFLTPIITITIMSMRHRKVQ